MKLLRLTVSTHSKLGIDFRADVNQEPIKFGISALRRNYYDSAANSLDYRFSL